MASKEVVSESSNIGWLDVTSPPKGKIFYGGLAIATALAIIGAIGVGVGTPILVGKSLWGLAKIITSFSPGMPYLMIGVGGTAILPILGYMLYGVIKLIQCKPSKPQIESKDRSEEVTSVGEDLLEEEVYDSLELSNVDFEMTLSQKEIKAWDCQMLGEHLGTNVIIFKKPGNEGGGYAYLRPVFDENRFDLVGKTRNTVDQLVKELKEIGITSCQIIKTRQDLEEQIPRSKETSPTVMEFFLGRQSLKKEHFVETIAAGAISTLIPDHLAHKFEKHFFIYKSSVGFPYNIAYFGYRVVRGGKKEPSMVVQARDERNIYQLRQYMQQAEHSGYRVVTSSEEVKKIIG